jgi:hypothetical protein
MRRCRLAEVDAARAGEHLIAVKHSEVVRHHRVAV